MNILLIAIGGALGTVARWGLAQLTPAHPGSIPWVTLGINVSGSFVLGFLGRLLASITPAPSPSIVAALTVGLCGGFTTFSTFSGETWQLLEGGQWGRAMGYALASVALSIAAFGAGLALARVMRPS